MLFLKKLRLKNFCNYEDHTFSFVNDSGNPYQFICFFGPNGCSKTSTLEAISMLTSDQTGRSIDHIKNSFKKYVRNDDYDPFYEHLKTNILEPMLIEGTYILDNKEYVVSINENGWIKNDFAEIDLETNELIYSPWGDDHLKYRKRICHVISSDSNLSMSTFQINKNKARQFENIVSQITRYPVECVEFSDFNDNKFSKEFYTDFVLIKAKNNKTKKVHFKRMSAGEKKISKSFSDLLNLVESLENPKSNEEPMTGWPRILTIDNVEMHIYYDRHSQMIECLKNVFSDKQIFATTHSGILIEKFLNKKNDTNRELWIDLEKINY